MERLTRYFSDWAHGAEGVSDKGLTGAYCRGKFEATAMVDRLATIEDILGDNYDLERLQGLVEIDQKKGHPVWVIERDEDGDPADVVGCIFVTAVNGVAIVSAYIHGCQDFESILKDKTDDTWRNGECDLAAYPLVDCYWNKEAAEQALRERSEDG